MIQADLSGGGDSYFQHNTPATTGHPAATSLPALIHVVPAAKNSEDAQGAEKYMSASLILRRLEREDLRKPGFTEEGRLRDEFFVDGEYRDALHMAIIQPEYLRRRKELTA